MCFILFLRMSENLWTIVYVNGEISTVRGKLKEKTKRRNGEKYRTGKLGKPS